MNIKIDHIAIWVEDIEKMRYFYMKYFNASCGEKYINPKKGYTSYFLSFPDSSCRIELMHRTDINEKPEQRGFIHGVAHICFCLGNKKAVDELTEWLRTDKYIIASEQRITGDGYYESAIFDPEGNYIELSD